MNVVDERDAAYGDAWKTYGLMMKPILVAFLKFSAKEPAYMFPWLMILNKLIRALTSPLNEDHWVDIQGYAELVLRDVRARSKNANNIPSK